MQSQEASIPTSVEEIPTSVEENTDTIGKQEENIERHLDNCYKLFDPERTISIREMVQFVQSPIQPVIIIAAFIGNTRSYVDMNVGDKFIQEYIKRFNLEDEAQLNELNELVTCIKSCVFSGKPLEDCSVFLYVWRKVLEKFIDQEQQEIVEAMEKVDLDASSEELQKKCVQMVDELTTEE